MFMLMPLGGLGMPELFLILIIIVLLFGGSKLKGVGRGLGEAISEFKKGMREGEAPPPGGNDPGKPPASPGA